MAVRAEETTVRETKEKIEKRVKIISFKNVYLRTRIDIIEIVENEKVTDFFLVVFMYTRSNKIKIVSNVLQRVMIFKIASWTSSIIIRDDFLLNLGKLRSQEKLSDK